MLKPYKLKIDTVLSGKDAVKFIEKGKVYDIVFMDHMMPEMDGIETIKKLRDLGYTRPVIALTANALAGQSEMFMQNGFDDYISKPIDVRQLDSALKRYVRDKQPVDVIEAAQQQHGNKNVKTEDLHEKLLIIRNLCADYDREAIMSLLTGIKSQSDETKALMEKIKQLVLNSKYGEVENLVAEYVDELN